jgi:hypothetical protein
MIKSKQLKDAHRAMLRIEAGGAPAEIVARVGRLKDLAAMSGQPGGNLRFL